MFMEHTDCMVFTKEDSELLEQYFDAVGQPPLKVYLLYSGGCPGAPGLMALFFGSLELIWTLHSTVVLLQRSLTCWTLMT